ncbi:MAG: phosphoesterase [Coxiella sp. RIFCSPHIGHO2_12_FULL_42_15]|nr:MAG: phosphoesterase [Coxiella sp. RIFCSPHIGHO2_12_FULL_42_15]
MAVSANAHWRDSARTVKFFIWDGKTAFPLLIFLLHMSWITLGIAVGAITFFTILNYFGYRADVFARIVRNFISGSRKAAIPWWEE